MYLCPWCQFLLERGRLNVLTVPFKEVARHVRQETAGDGGGHTCAVLYHLNVYLTVLFVKGGVELELFQLLMHYRQIAPPHPDPHPLRPLNLTHTPTSHPRKSDYLLRTDTTPR